MQNHAPEKIAEKAITDPGFRKIITTDAVILAGLTVSAYIFHYFFEFGYLSYFGIPVAFISFNLPEMIPAIFTLVAMYLIFVFVLWPYLHLLSTVLPGFLKTILIFVPWFVIFVFLGFSWEIILLLLFGLLIWGIDPVRQYQARRMARKGLKPEHNSDQSSINSERQDSTEPQPSFDARVSGMRLTGSRRLWLYLLFTALISSYTFGRVAAMTRTSYPIADTAPLCAVVYATADHFICKPLSSTNEFENRFIILNIGGYQNIEFGSRSIGPLRPKTSPE